jgi:catechol 2,3-dioxygenase-like lactoylglutathione lyase family enzyme
MKNSEHFEPRKLSRRLLMQNFGVTAATAVAMSAVPKAFAAMVGAAAPAEPGKFPPVLTINHVSLAATDYAKSRDWYQDLFGMRLTWDDGKKCALEFGSASEPNGIFITQVPKAGDPAVVGHFALGANDVVENLTAMKAEMERRGLKGIRPDGAVGWSALDPAGYQLNTWVPMIDTEKAMYPGAATPCAVVPSAACADAYQAGLKNLALLPKVEGKAFQASSYSSVVLNVPEADIAKEKEFYTGMLGMKLIYENKDSANPTVFLRFGRNTLFLRKTDKPDQKPYVNHYGFVIDNYDHRKVEEELKRRGLNPTSDSKLSWIVADPDGMSVEVSGWGLAEHLAKDCAGAASSCPVGERA